MPQHGKFFISYHGDFNDYIFYCPGCKCSHVFSVNNNNMHSSNPPRWSFNGDIDCATFQPSLLCNKDYPDSRCHLFLHNGKIQFLNDCHHQLAGQTVDMIDDTR